MKPWMWAVVAGIGVGFAYTLSPMTVIATALLFPLWKAGAANLTDTAGPMRDLAELMAEAFAVQLRPDLDGINRRDQFRPTVILRIGVQLEGRAG